jgi:hypothetical protein
LGECGQFKCRPSSPCKTSANASLTDVLVTLNSAVGGKGGGHGIGGGLYIGGGTVTLSLSTEVFGNRATTSNNNIFGPFIVS